MATRALAAAAVGRRASGHGALAILSPSGSCCRRGGAAQSFSHSTAEREREGHAGADVTAATAAQVEAALNRKNVEVVQGDRSATLVAADVAEALGGVGDAAGAEDAWVPDQETGVFVPAEEASGDGDGADGGALGQQAGPSVLDQVVFVREEDIEDVERPAADTVDMADAK